MWPCIHAGNFTDNGSFGQMLNDLENCGFIRCYHNPCKEKKDALFQLIDPFTIFYYEFIRNNTKHDPHYWTHCLNTSTYKTWCGLSFERVCLLHTEQIKNALGISGVIAGVYSWRSASSRPGAQIDMVIDRDDDVIDLCEMKYTASPFEMGANELDDLLRKENVFVAETGTKKAVHKVLISANGVSRNEYSDELQNTITLDDLFLT